MLTRAVHGRKHLLFMATSNSVSPLTTGSLYAALAGAGGGLLSFGVGEIVGAYTLQSARTGPDLIGLIVGSALWSGAIGLTIGAAILVWDNLQSLRGQWHRDLLLGLPLLFALSFVGGAAGQISFMFVHNPLTRGIGWALMGAGVGVGIGVLRRDMLQAARGALGGALGGFVGGFIFDALIQVSDAGGGSFSRLVGQIIMGALIALLMRVVQDALKNAWLLGISSGPYEGKEYPLNVARVSVGRDDSNAIALFREPDLPAQMGELIFQNDAWHWRGQSITINGIAHTDAPLNPGDTLQLGATRFRFQTRSRLNPNAIAPTVTEPPRIAPSVALAPNAATIADYAPAASPARPPVAASAPTVIAPPTFTLMAMNGQLLRLPPLDKPISIGRVAGNDVVLNDAGVSSRHARLEWSGGALRVTDLGSTNGTFVNGARLAPNAAKSLAPGDRLRFGKLDYSLRAG